MPTRPQYRVRDAASDEDLRQILALQRANLPHALDQEERREQGFVTLQHDLPLLREMNSPHAHIVATPAQSDEVIAYALTMLQKFRGRLPALDPMFDQLDRLEYRGRPLTEWRYFIMGQVCVARLHRGFGLVERLYALQRQSMAPHFDLAITEIDRANPRSIRAHEKAGFQVLHEYRANTGAQWLIVASELRALNE